MAYVLRMYKVSNTVLRIYRKCSVFTCQGQNVLTSLLFASAVVDAYLERQGKPFLSNPDPGPAETTPVHKQ